MIAALNRVLRKFMQDSRDIITNKSYVTLCVKAFCVMQKRRIMENWDKEHSEYPKYAFCLDYVNKNGNNPEVVGIHNEA